MVRRIIDLTGHRYGYLTVVQFVCRLNNHSMFKCVCDCGKQTIVTGNNLRRNHTTSCGCMSSKKTIGIRSSTHMMTNHPLYQTWTGMINRCYWSKHNRSKHYMLKGITVCDEWRYNFIKFKDWAFSNGWEKGLSLDRINNDGNYEPSNCRWATNKEQARNRSSNVWIEINGISQIATVWAEEYNISPATIHNRMTKGWSGYDAVCTPLFKRKKNI